MTFEEIWAILKENVSYALRQVEEQVITSEAFYTLTDLIQIQIRNSEITESTQGVDGGIGFRTLIKNHQLGFASTNSFLNKKAVLQAVQTAITLARISTSNENAVFPTNCIPPTIKGLYDKKVCAITVEEALKIAKNGLVAAEEVDNRVKVKRGAFSIANTWKGVQNAFGLEVDTQKTQAALYYGTIAQEAGQVTGLCTEIKRSSSLDFDALKQGRTAANKALSFLNPQTIPSFTGSVIFSPEVVSEQLFTVITEALKGDNVNAKASAWADRLGSEVAKQTVIISDNPLLEGNFASQPFDDEGCASSHTLLIKNGELKQFLHHSTSAKVVNDHSTGNASRSGIGWDITRLIIGTGYKTQPIVYPHNLIIEPGTKTQEEIIREMDHGLFIDSIAGFPQAGSGLVSAQISRGFKIEQGELEYPVKNTMVVGNVYEWLHQITGISTETEQFNFCNVPALRVENVKIIGKD